MCAPSPPAPPDYAAAAKEQGASNVETARIQGRLNNPSVVSPYGTQTVSYGTFDQPGYNQALASYERQLQQYNENAAKYREPVWDPHLERWEFVQGVMPGKPEAPSRDAYFIGADQPTITQTFSPSEQALYDTSQQAKLALSQLALKGGTSAQGVLGTGVNFAGMPRQGEGDILTAAPALSSTALTAGAPELRSSDLMAGAPALGSTAFTAGAAPLPQDAVATRNAAYNAIMSRVNEDTAIQRDELHSNLIAAGIRPGSDAYDDRMRLLNRQYTDAQQQAILSANQQAQQDFAQAMQLRQQTVGEARDIFGATAQARAQAQAEQQAMFGASNVARAQAVQEAKDILGATAAARGQYVSEQQAEQAAMDTARKQAIAEYLMLRQVPLNEITALMSGSQVTNPFAMPGYAQNTQIAPPPVYQSAADRANYLTDVYNTQVQNAANQQGGAFGLGGAGLMALGLAL